MPTVFQALFRADTLRNWYLVVSGCGLSFWHLLVVGVVVFAVVCLWSCFSLTKSIDLHHTHPPTIQDDSHDAHRLTMKCWWWVVLVVLKLTSPRTNRNPLTHEPTPTYHASNHQATMVSVSIHR